MRTLNVVLIFIGFTLSGCHWFKGGPKKEELSNAPGEKRTIATTPEAQAMYDRYESEIASGKCATQVLHKVKSVYRAEGSWVKGPGGLDGSDTYLSPTTQIGRWIGVRKFQSGDMQLLIITKNRLEIRAYNAPACTFTNDVRNTAFTGTQMAEDGEPVLTDDDLSKLMERLKFGIVYVWSPGMVFSYSANLNRAGSVSQRGDPTSSGLNNAHEAMMKAAEKMHVAMGMTVAADPAAPRALIKQVFDSGNHDLKSEHLKKMASLDMMLRSMGQHYPALLVYGNGKIYRQIKPGVASVENYQQFIEDAITALKK